MRFAITFLGIGMMACGSSSSPAPSATPRLAIAGYGVQLVPSPSTSATVLPNGVVIFGPRADAPLPARVRNVAVKPGAPPKSALVPHPDGAITIYSDGSPETTSIATGVEMTSYDGVLSNATLSPRSGAWVIVAEGKEQEWRSGVRLDVAADGHSFTLVTLPAK